MECNRITQISCESYKIDGFHLLHINRIMTQLSHPLYFLLLIGNLIPFYIECLYNVDTYNVVFPSSAYRSYLAPSSVIWLYLKYSAYSYMVRVMMYSYSVPLIYVLCLYQWCWCDLIWVSNHIKTCMDLLWANPSAMASYPFSVILWCVSS